MADQVQVVGLQRLQSDLHRLAGQLTELAPPAAGQVIGSAARMRAPKRTGHLAGSFSSTPGGGVLLLRFGAPYAAPLHFGVGARPGQRGPHNIRANPYLFGAVDDTQPRWLGAYEDQLQQLADKVKGA